MLRWICPECGCEWDQWDRNCKTCHPEQDSGNEPLVAMMCALAPPAAHVNLTELIRDSEARPMTVEPPIAIPVIWSVIEPLPVPGMVVNFRPVVLRVASVPVLDARQTVVDMEAEYAPVIAQAPGPVHLMPRWLSTFLLTVWLVLGIALGVYLLVRVINYRASTPSPTSNPPRACLQSEGTARGV